MGVAAEAVELGDHQSRAVVLAGLQRLVQRRAIVIVLAGFDLDVLLPAAAVEEGRDGVALSLDAEAALALPFGRDAAFDIRARLDGSCPDQGIDIEPPCALNRRPSR